MCGIAGIVLPSFSSLHAGNVVSRMVDTLVHRGPDAGDVWCDENSGVALAHRRLAVLDLSPAGHQPMHSVCGRYVIVFNGEIYNHLDLRQALAGEAISWRGHSDTETLLACIVAWGLAETLKAAVGMFALAVWDRYDRSLSLARDRFGEKPLYYGWHAGSLIFGSELRAFTRHPEWRGEIDRDALALYLRHNYVPAPHSIYAGICKLPAGHFVRWQVGREQSVEATWPNTVPYWSIGEIALAGIRKRDGTRDGTGCDEESTLTHLESLLDRSIRRQMLSDVPLGAFLSGGVDSSLVVALMQKASMTPVQTFTIGFQEKDYDEAAFAKAVAAHLGTQHHELYVTPEDALQVVPRLPGIYDEPFADASQIPTFLLTSMARGLVTVALSGDGGDELFGGYSRYLFAARLWGRIRRIPRPLRHLLAGLIRNLPVDLLHGAYLVAAPLLPRHFRLALNGERWRKGAAVLACDDGLDVYERLMTYWNPAELMPEGQHVEFLRQFAEPAMPNLTDQMMVTDAMSYLTDDIMVKVDRAAMAVSLETRSPFLDHEVAEYAWTLPSSMKIRKHQGKWALRRILDRYVPAALIDRPKMGFGVPIDSWLRGPLRDWAESLIDPIVLRRDGLFAVEPIRRAWERHLGGRCNLSYHLWGILMFQSWLRAQEGGRAT